MLTAVQGVHMPKLKFSHLYILSLLWVLIQVLTSRGFHGYGREIVACIRLGFGLVLAAALWTWLRKSGHSATEGMGWHVLRDPGLVVCAVILAMGAVGLHTVDPGDLVGVLQPALVEDTLFFGFAFAFLLREHGNRKALLWSGLFFGLAHLSGGLGAALGAAFLGFLFLGTARLATGNVMASVIIHAVFNAGEHRLALSIWAVAVIGSGLVLARKKRKTQIQYPRDAFLQLGERLEAVVGHPWIAWPIAFELNLWNRKSPVFHLEEGISLMRPETLGVRGALGALIVLLVLEGSAVHVMIHGLGDVALSWAVTAVEFLGLCWIFAFRRQMKLRHTALYPECLVIRTGLLWTAQVPRAQILEVKMTEVTKPPSRCVMPMEQANICLVLSEALTCRSLWGWPVSVHALHFRVDKPKDVLEWHLGN